MLYSCMNNTTWNKDRVAMVSMESPLLWKNIFLIGYLSSWSLVSNRLSDFGVRGCDQ